jgi:hypothetical protein
MSILSDCNQNFHNGSSKIHHKILIKTHQFVEVLSVLTHGRMDLHYDVKCLFFLSFLDFSKTKSSRDIFENSPNISLYLVLLEYF